MDPAAELADSPRAVRRQARQSARRPGRPRRDHREGRHALHYRAQHFAALSIVAATRRLGSEAAWLRLSELVGSIDRRALDLDAAALDHLDALDQLREAVELAAVELVDPHGSPVELREASPPPRPPASEPHTLTSSPNAPAATVAARNPIPGRAATVAA